MSETAPSGIPDSEPGLAKGMRHPYALPMHCRIRDPKRYRTAFDNGLCLRGRYQVVWGLPRGDSEWRFGVIASKRTFRRAVDRARAKRLVREAFRLHRNSFPSGGELVIVCRRAILQAKTQDVSVELCRLVQKLCRQGKQTHAS